MCNISSDLKNTPNVKMVKVLFCETFPVVYVGHARWALNVRKMSSSAVLAWRRLA